MKINKLSIALATVVAGSTLSLVGCIDESVLVSTPPVETTAKTVDSVEFTSTPAPSTAAEMATTYTTSKAIVKYTDGTSETFNLEYDKLFTTLDTVGTNPNPAGQLYDMNGTPLMDPNGAPLLKVGDSIYLVSHLEYDWLYADGSRATSRAPMGMLQTKIAQN